MTDRLTSKEQAMELMLREGFPCEVVNGVLTFHGEFSPKEYKRLRSTMERIGYTASYSLRRKSNGQRQEV